MDSATPYLAAWRILPHLPYSVSNALCRGISWVVTELHGSGVQQLQKNHTRIMGRPPTHRELHAAVYSHFRNYLEQFLLSDTPIGRQLLRDVDVDRKADIIAMVRQGPLVVATPHSGSWDRVAGYAPSQDVRVVSVAEKLNPPRLFEAFIDFRENLGMEILGVGKGESVFAELVEKTRGRQVLIPLLADRDISGSGIDVSLNGYAALVAAGPAALAQAIHAPLIAAVIDYIPQKRGPARVRMRWEGPIEVPTPQPGETAVEAHTRAWVAAMEPLLADSIRDWHMMQPVFVEDLDQERLARAKARHQQMTVAEPLTSDTSTDTPGADA